MIDEKKSICFDFEEFKEFIYLLINLDLSLKFNKKTGNIERSEGSFEVLLNGEIINFVNTEDFTLEVKLSNSREKIIQFSKELKLIHKDEC